MSVTRPLRVWSNYDFHEACAEQLRVGVAGHNLALVSSAVSAPDPEEPVPDILLGQPAPAYLLAQRPRWVEITSAGYTKYDRDDLRAALREAGSALTNTSRVFDEACAQHLLAMILAWARELPRCWENQRGAREWLHDEPRLGRRFLLNGQKVLIYGFGTIARRMVELLRPLGMEVVGVRRSPKGDEGVPMLSEAEADNYLGTADHVLNILPASDSTHHYFDAARLACCKPGGRFYNIGRGVTVNQEALAEVLHSGHLQVAYLDVTDPEPLPPEHPLWDLPNCLITPHIAGTHDNEEARLVEHFLSNLAAFQAGTPLQDQII